MIGRIDLAYRLNDWKNRLSISQIYKAKLEQDRVKVTHQAHNLKNIGSIPRLA